MTLNYVSFAKFWICKVSLQLISIFSMEKKTLKDIVQKYIFRTFINSVKWFHNAFRILVFDFVLGIFYIFKFPCPVKVFTRAAYMLTLLTIIKVQLFFLPTNISLSDVYHLQFNNCIYSSARNINGWKF